MWKAARLASYFRRHKFFWGISFFVFVIAFGALWGSYSVTHRKITTYFQQIYEKKNFDQLQVFYRGMETYFRDAIGRYARLASSLAGDARLRQAVEEGDLEKVEEILDQERRFHDRVDSLAIIDRNGTALHISSDFSDVSRFIGQDVSFMKHVRQTLDRKKALLVDVPDTPSGRNTLFFTEPVFDSSGDLRYIVTVSATLDTLAAYLDLPSTLSEYDVVLLDQEGNMLFENGKIVNRAFPAENDRGLRSLLEGREIAVEDEEVNYAGKRVFLKGCRLEFGEGKYLYFATYYPIHQFDAEKAGLKREIDALFFGFGMKSLAVLAVFMSVLAWIIRRHDKAVHSQ